MKTFATKILAGAGLAAVAAFAVTLDRPVDTAAYTLIGGSLGTAQRDFRVWNNYTDTQANNNTTPHPSFPGQTGAVMAIWKGHVEWASEPYAGTGAGDGVASNPVLGNGGGNFDNTFQGTATSAGGTNDNIHSELSGNGGSTLAYTETPISNGWRILYYSSWTWQDGPANVTTGVDLQGVACHEIGHSLGLGHSTASGGPTMYYAITGTGVGQRSIESDDVAGLQAVYGVKSASKPHIGSLSGSKQIGQTLTINGTNFGATGNEVWFTKLNSNGDPVKVTGVNSTGGGTQIDVTVPNGIQDGDVLVKVTGTGGASLSNAWPIDIGAPAGDPPFLSSISPTAGAQGGYTEVTLTGSGFSGVNSVTFGGVPAIDFTYVNGNTVTAISPPGTLFTQVGVTITDPEGSSTLPSAFLYTFNPATSINAIDVSSGPVAGGTTVVISGASVVGVTEVQFGGVAGTDLSIVSATELTVVPPPAAGPGPVDVTAIGAGNSTLPGGFTYVDIGAFVNIGPGVSGVFLQPPLLTGTGDLSPGSGTGFTIHLQFGYPLQQSVLFVSLNQGAAPFKCGTFYALPIIFQLPVTMDSVGETHLPAQIPLGTPPGTSFVMQFWVHDPTACQQTSGSNGLKAIVP